MSVSMTADAVIERRKTVTRRKGWLLLRPGDRLTAERDALAAQVARVEALAEEWRYKGQFGWGAWQIGEGPDPEGYVMDHCASALRAALAGFEADTTDTQSTDQEVK